MKQGLFERGSDLTIFQRLRRPVVVHHAAWSLSVASEEEAAEPGHLKRDKEESRGTDQGI